MNAYELAKYLYRLNGYMDMPRDILDITQPSADMLHQQADRIVELEKQNEALEQLRPYWAKGFSNDNVAAQCTVSAMSELHKLLGANNQTDAVIKIKQQQKRIAELEKQSEPVAWFDGKHYVCPEIGYEYTITTEHPKTLGWKPLYATPQIKPLSDEEIWEWFEKNTALTKESALMIGRAIEAKVRGEK